VTEKGGEGKVGFVTVISGNEIARTSECEGARCSVPVEVNHVTRVNGCAAGTQAKVMPKIVYKPIL
jgi:hypothetical protein